MSRLKSLVCFVLLLAAACSDPSQPTEGQSKPVFRIHSIAADSLYGGEHTYLTAEKMGDSADSLRLYIGTFEAEIDSLVDSRLYFAIPRNASSGLVRLYKGDTLAKGEFNLFLWGRDLSEFHPRAVGLSPSNPFPGETMRIVGRDFPMRKSAIEILLNDTPVQISNWDSTWIEFMLPDPAEELYQVYLNVRGKNLTGWRVVPSQYEGDLPTRDMTSALTLEIYGLLGQVELRFTDPDSTFIRNASLESIIRNTSRKVSFHVRQAGDSIIATHDSTFADGSIQYVLSLLRKPLQHVDGRLTISTTSKIGTAYESIYDLNLRFEGLRWQQVDMARWYLKSAAGKIGDAVREFEYFIKSGDQGYQGRLLNWQPRDDSPSTHLSIQLLDYD